MSLKMREIRNLDNDQLEKKEEELFQELAESRFSINTSKQSDVKRIRVIKRDIARIKTVIRENMALEAQPSGSEG
jgi:large subunit ribosomal protein L29